MKITHKASITQKMQCLYLGLVLSTNVNGYLLTKKLRNKKLVKVRLFSGAKVRCMYNHVKPTIREFDPNHIILHVGRNELRIVRQLVRY